jgi:hypothetical protein
LSEVALTVRRPDSKIQERAADEENQDSAVNGVAKITLRDDGGSGGGGGDPNK